MCKKLSASNGIAISVVKDFGLDEFRLRLQGGFMRYVPILIRNMRYINRQKIMDNYLIINKKLHALE